MARSRQDAPSWHLSCLVALFPLGIACGEAAPELPVAQPVSILSPDAPVMVTGGRIQGALSETHSEIIAFRGVPFAAPPVGDLRWRPPAAVAGWDGIREASESGSACPQRNRTGQTEDCLFLNVFTPAETAEPLPVMVWIHGGGFRGGSGGDTNGAPLAAKGAVVVSINYRLGVFGFLAHPALSAESEHGASGNQGLLDMVAALEWVRDNIASVNGDPDRVTIFGESAGGGAVMALMLVPQAEGLFHGGIAESTYVHGWDRPLDTPARGWEPAEATTGIVLAEALGASGDDVLAAMRAATTDEVLAVADDGPLFRWADTFWAPNVDGWVIPDDPLQIYASGRQRDVPLIAGMNANEGSIFRSRFEMEDVGGFESYVRRDFEVVADEAIAFYDVASPDAIAAGLDHLIHDMFFAGPIRVQVQAHAQASSPAWLYHFAQVPPTQMGANLGAYHSAEIPYVFGTLDDRTPWTDADRRVSDMMMSYWVQFATTGDPNGGELPAWPAFDPSTDEYSTFADPVATGTALHREGAALFDLFEARRREQ